MQVGVVDRISLEFTKVGRYAEHHAATAILRIVLEELQQPLDSDLVDVLGTIRKAHSPNDDQGLASVVEIGLIRSHGRDFEPIHQFLPILDD